MNVRASRHHLLVAAAVVTALGLSALLAVQAPGRSPADADTTVRITAAGDYSFSAEADQTLAAIGRAGAAAHLALGDLAYTADPENRWCDFVTARVGAGFPFELVAGNHESNGQHGHINNFSACLPNQVPGAVGTYGREYYLDLPRSTPLVRTIAISAGQTFPDGTWNYAVGDPHYTWLRNAIDDARADGIPWVVVAVHFPCLSASAYSCVMPRSVVDLLQEKKVDLVLSGHDHAYMRTHQIRSGVPGCPTLVVDAYDADCVTDRDDDYRKGQGTVFATVGTGGVALRDIDTADAEFPYFAATSGLNRNPTWGFLDISASATQLEAAFVRSTGGTFSDRFRVVAAPNQAPTAAFTSTTSGLSVAVDGRSSSDSDGTVTGYSWDFGDGSGASGAQPAAHAYAQAGSYPITLTVTDDSGATATSTSTVTVTAPTGGIPPVPLGLTASATGPTTVALAWDAAAGATGYRVLRDGAEVGRPTGTRFTDTGLAPLTGYRYSVQAVGPGGTSAAGPEVGVTTRGYVTSGDTWRFWDSATTPAAAWRDAGFADGSWKSGPSQLGYGDGDEATVLGWGTNATTKPVTAYFRTTFDAGSSIGDVKSVALRALVDDGAVVYLNGTEVWRFNLPTGAVTATTRASRFIAGAEENQWRTATVPPTALRAGSNTVAVEVHQDQPSSSDLSLDLELRPQR